MTARQHNAFRAYAGDAALVLGCIGLVLFVLAIPLAIFDAQFWGGFGFREGPQPSPAELHAAISREFWRVVCHGLMPLFVLSATLFSYGVYEHYKQRQTEPDRATA